MNIDMSINDDECIILYTCTKSMCNILSICHNSVSSLMLMRQYNNNSVYKHVKASMIFNVNKYPCKKFFLFTNISQQCTFVFNCTCCIQTQVIIIVFIIISIGVNLIGLLTYMSINDDECIIVYTCTKSMCNILSICHNSVSSLMLMRQYNNNSNNFTLCLS
jgi:hypothetical protein